LNTKWFSLIAWVSLCLLVGLTGSFFSPGEWYQAMQKPSLTPPNVVFPIVEHFICSDGGSSLACMEEAKAAR